MADYDPERNDENSDNIFEILQKQNIAQVTTQTLEGVKHENTNGNITNAKKSKVFRNLPGLQVAHVVKEETNNEETPPDPKRPRLTGLPVTNTPDTCPSPDTGKRRRIQHDYRRLSNSGYLDDYVSGRERRFSSASDNSDLSMSPSPPKLKTPVSPSIKLVASSDLSQNKGTVALIYINEIISL